jgi:ubiquinone/menaquinone biosynthesis C-methylase UbiE
MHNFIDAGFFVSGPREHYRGLLFSNCPGKKVLELGCYNSIVPFLLTEKSAKVIAIDSSKSVIAKRPFLKNPSFVLMNAEQLDFPDNSFDLVYGAGILRYLDLKKALPEIARVLKPNGKAIFFETLSINPIIFFTRSLSNVLFKKKERDLSSKDLSMISSFFKKSLFSGYFLSYLASRFLFSENTRKFLNFVDESLFKLSFFKLLSWGAVLQLEAPKKEL